MLMRLSDEDGRAVDLLLDRPVTEGDGNGNGGSHYVATAAAAADIQVQGRITAASRVIQLLDNLDAPAPSPDLVQRTLRKIEEIAAAGEHMAVPAGATIADPAARQQPHA